MQDAYTWRALYHDGTTISEDDRPEGRGFAEVDAEQVKRIHLEPLDADQRSHFVDIPSGAIPVLFRRRSIEMSADEDTRQSTVAHCIGWKRDDRAVYLFVFDGGSTLLSDDLQAV